MPTYVTLVKFTSEGLKSFRELQVHYQQGMRKAGKMGIKMIAAYGILGACDMMFVYEAPDEKAAASINLPFAPRGTALTETWTAIPMEEFLKLAGRIGV